MTKLPQVTTSYNLFITYLKDTRILFLNIKFNITVNWSQLDRALLMLNHLIILQINYKNSIQFNKTTF